ncbi:sortase A [Streptomyces sp. 1114.5]|uniref:class E sortase n=1 Tax=unclassified Streptomyces TaxID=2593676 RepID=UPI000BCF3574|nr:MULTISPECIES: class E sortase [unclassified Streptomyces]RKT16736.1 sortase A [Streptomyces sp. 1114.5]SOB82907.1 sortase A [Streptomyces sp. 1331.2]
MTTLRPEGRYQPEAAPYGSAQQYQGVEPYEGLQHGAPGHGAPYGDGSGGGHGGAPYRPEHPGQGVPEDAWGVYEQAEEPPAGGPEYPWLPDQTLQLRLPAAVGAQAAEPVPPTGGRAERRRAAQGRTAIRSGSGRRRASGRAAGQVRPKESVAVVAARLVGELCITLGAVMLLFVAYQLWWTNVQADAAADGARNRLEQQFDAAPPPGQPGQPAPDPNKPEVFEPGKGFAIVYLPKLGLKFPIAEGTSKSAVLDKGLVGHYTGTAMPGDKTGNFALAAHRNTHGEPFRYINQLSKGDKVVVETAAGYYTYEITGGIPETSPTNVSVIKPVPNGSGYTGPGRYITLTTCTPEFTSKFRLIVFGKMIEERPRSQGKPAALAGG